MAMITVARAGEPGMGAALLDSMYRLRTDVFHHRLGWDVRVENGREHDWFDLVGPHYLVAQESPGTPRAIGCCRLLPTLGPNMLRDIFPTLLDGAPAPAGERILEVSRFAVDEERTRGGYGFSDLPAAMVAEVVRFAAMQGMDAVVGVTSAPFERMLGRLGLRVERLGTPRRIGRVMSLAFRLPIDEGNQRAMGVTLDTALTKVA